MLELKTHKTIKTDQTITSYNSPVQYIVILIMKVYLYIVIPLPEGATISMTYFSQSNGYTDEGGIKSLYHGLSACSGNHPLAKARGLSPRTGGQTMVELLHTLHGRTITYSQLIRWLLYTIVSNVLRLHYNFM